MIMLRWTCELTIERIKYKHKYIMENVEVASISEKIVEHIGLCDGLDTLWTDKMIQLQWELLWKLM